MDMYGLDVRRYLQAICEYNVLLLVTAICLALIQWVLQSGPFDRP